jgi:Zn-dependent M16 (insulinase) family peptidase
VRDAFAGFGPPRSRDGVTLALNDGINLYDADAAKPEVFLSPALQIGFAGLALEASPYGHVDAAAETLLCHYLSTGALWEELRMKGGAYGANAACDSLERIFTLSTYRDPDPPRSAASFAAILSDVAAARLSPDALEKTLIGAYSKVKYPHTGAEKGWLDFQRLLYGIEDGARQRSLKDLLEADAAAVQAAATRMAARCALAAPVILAGPASAEKAAAALGVQPQRLPC